MKEKLIDYETAVLAKEKGFDIECAKNYCLETHKFPTGLLAVKEQLYPFRLGVIRNACAPAQSLLQKWLRDEHNIIVEINHEYFDTTLYFSCTIFRTEFKYTNLIYEQALETGLHEALKLI